MFFTKKEQKLLKSAQTSNNILLGRLKLNAIVYLDRTHWTIWLNGRRVTTGENLPFITIHTVTQDQVHCTWLANGQHHDVKLGPGQTFYIE